MPESINSTWSPIILFDKRLCDVFYTIPGKSCEELHASVELNKGTWRLFIHVQDVTRMSPRGAMRKWDYNLCISCNNVEEKPERQKVLS